MKKLFIILILFSCFSFAKMSFNETLKLAEQGNATSQFNLGVMYLNGEGVRLNKSKSLHYLY